MATSYIIVVRNPTTKKLLIIADENAKTPLNTRQKTPPMKAQP